VTIDLAAGLGGLAAFLALYSAILSAFNFSAASSSSSSEPNRSTSSSSSSAAAPEAAGKVSNSSARAAMWLNHLAKSG